MKMHELAIQILKEQVSTLEAEMKEINDQKLKLEESIADLQKPPKAVAEKHVFTCPVCEDKKRISTPVIGLTRPCPNCVSRQEKVVYPKCLTCKDTGRVASPNAQFTRPCPDCVVEQCKSVYRRTRCCLENGHVEQLRHRDQFINWTACWTTADADAACSIPAQQTLIPYFETGTNMRESAAVTQALKDGTIASKMYDHIQKESTIKQIAEAFAGWWASTNNEPFLERNQFSIIELKGLIKKVAREAFYAGVRYQEQGRVATSPKLIERTQAK